LILLIALAMFCLPADLKAMTAHEILEEVIKQNFHGNFRIALRIKTFKGKKVLSNHTAWLVGRAEANKSIICLDFDEPKESKGLRFLFIIETEKEPEAYMYLPATGKTLSLALDTAAEDIGGTGLTMEDFQTFAAQPGQKESIVKEEKIDGHDCYVVRVTLPGGRGDRLLWISKDRFQMIKSAHLDAKGKTKRTFRVVKFFKTKKGRFLPREEEIIIPGKGLRIEVRQDHAVFGIEIPDELLDPKSFGKFRWRM